MKRAKYVLLLLIVFILIALGIFINNNRNSIKQNDQDSNSANIAEIKKEDNIIEVYQTFQHQNSNENELVSSVHDLNIINSSATMMSAYSLDNLGSYKLYYRVYFDGKWDIWKSIDENIEEVNPLRKIFGPIIIPNDIEKMQFKSTESTNSEVIFRFFLFNFNEN